MAYTFGGATTDDITFASALTIGANSRAALICGWWYPTTLTATRKLWSVNTTGIVGAEIDTTTSELRLRSDNTTDGQWTTTGVNLATNTWKFLAFLCTFNNTGPTVAWDVWAGDAENVPQLVTVTSAVSPVGNNTGNANFYIGNAGTGSLAFQGDIGWIAVVNTSAAAGTFGHPFQLLTFGVINDITRTFVFERFIQHLWKGNNFMPNGNFNRNASLTATTEDYTVIDLDKTLPVVYGINLANATAFVYRAATINGAVPSANRSPVPAPYPIISPATLKR